MSRGTMLHHGASALLLAAAAGAAACPPLPARQQAELIAAVEAVDAALRAGRREALEPLLAASFTQLLGNGQRVDRERFVGALTGSPPADYTVAAHRYCGWRDTAVVTYDATFASPGGGLPVSTFIVDLFHRHPRHGWQLAFEQIGVRR